MYRSKTGQFDGAGTTNARAKEDDRLVDRVEFRVTSLDWRRLMILFQHHRQQFACEIQSDIFRYVMRKGLASTEDEVRHPTDEGQDLRMQSEGMEMAMKAARRHTMLDTLLERAEEDIHLLMKAGDLGAIRNMLIDFKAQTRKVKDHAIRGRREMEFDKRWGSMFDSLNRSARLPTGEED
jgi:hypothetical protein